MTSNCLRSRRILHRRRRPPFIISNSLNRILHARQKLQQRLLNSRKKKKIPQSLPEGQGLLKRIRLHRARRNSLSIQLLMFHTRLRKLLSLLNRPPFTISNSLNRILHARQKPQQRLLNSRKKTKIPQSLPEGLLKRIRLHRAPRNSLSIQLLMFHTRLRKLLSLLNRIPSQLHPESLRRRNLLLQQRNHNLPRKL